MGIKSTNLKCAPFNGHFSQHAKYKFQKAKIVNAKIKIVIFVFNLLEIALIELIIYQSKSNMFYI